MGFNFEKLDVYEKSIDFADDIYKLAKGYPKEEMFCLVSQLRRAAVSISANIAEGSARSKKDFARFLDISRGSVFECVVLLKVSLKQGYFGEEVFERFEGGLTDISKMLSGLKRSIDEQ